MDGVFGEVEEQTLGQPPGGACRVETRRHGGRLPAAGEVGVDLPALAPGGDAVEHDVLGGEDVGVVRFGSRCCSP